MTMQATSTSTEGAAKNPVPCCLATALAALAAGLSVIPIANDGSKKTLLPSWKEYQSRRATPEEVRAWYKRWPEAGLAIIAGAVSGNLEIADFDNRDTYREYHTLAATSNPVLKDVLYRVLNGYLEMSPKGVHFIYRCEVAGSGNQKLATRPAPGLPNRVETLIETRGEGGYVIIAPSSGRVHPTGKPYQLISGDFTKIVTVTLVEHTMMLEMARSFHQTQALAQVKLTQSANAPISALPRQNAPGAGAGVGAEAEAGGVMPGDDFNQRATWAEVLEPAGWVVVKQIGGKTHWRRPGKSDGESGISDEGVEGLFKCFSSSTVFDSGSGHAYSKFNAYAMLYHDGNASKAASDLAAKSYGKAAPRPDPVEKKTPPPLQLPQTSPQPQPQSPIEPEEIQSPNNKKLYHIDELANIPPPDWLLDGQLQRDSIAMLAGESGIGKTFIALDMALQIAETEDVIYISSEGGGTYSERTTAWRTEYELRANHFYYWSESVQPHTPDSLYPFLEAIAHLKPALIVVDTLARSAVGLEENSAKDMGLFATGLDVIRRATGAAVLVIHHTTKNGGWERGSSALKGFIDTLITVTGDKDSVTIECKKQRGAPDFPTRYVTWKQVGACRVPVAATGDAQVKTPGGKITDAARKILEALANPLFAETGAKATQLYEAMGTEKSGQRTKAIYKWLGQLKLLGYITQGVKGEPYQLTVAGRDILDSQPL